MSGRLPREVLVLFEKVSSVNWIAVVAAGVAMFFIGGAWYGALFQRRWHRLSGYSPEALALLKKRTPPPIFFGWMVVCYFAIAAVMGVLAAALDVKAPGPGAALGGLVAVVMVAALWTGYPPTDRHRGLFVIEAAFLLIATPVAGAILGAWR